MARDKKPQKKVLLSLDEEVLVKLDKQVEVEDETRVEVLRKAVDLYLETYFDANKRSNGDPVAVGGSDE